MESNVYFHEDDYCQIEILPIENMEFCLKQADLMSNLAEAHKTDLGYTDVFVRKSNPTLIYDKKLLITSLEKVFEGVLPKFGEVYTGYGSYKEKCENINAFGINSNVVMFYDTKDNFIANIWLTLNIWEEKDIIIATQIFNALIKLGDFIIADWEWKFIQEINNGKIIESYLKKRLEAFSSWESNKNPLMQEPIKKESLKKGFLSKFFKK